MPCEGAAGGQLGGRGRGRAAGPADRGSPCAKRVPGASGWQEGAGRSRARSRGGCSSQPSLPLRGAAGALGKDLLCSSDSGDFQLIKNTAIPI